MNLPHHLSRFTQLMLRIRVHIFASQYRLFVILAMLMLPALACGLINPQYRLKNEVRLAVYKYEREVRGPVDDLVIHFNRDEPRLKFAGQNENGGRTVWLYDLGAREYFALRPRQATYLYIQTIEFSDDYKTATVAIYRGDGASFAGRWLTVAAGENEQWLVIDDVAMTSSGSESSTQAQ